jgi:hypothetical protein
VQATTACGAGNRNTDESQQLVVQEKETLDESKQLVVQEKETYESQQLVGRKKNTR